MLRNSTELRDSVVRQRDRCILAAVISFVTLALYLPALRNGFVNLDDDILFFNNVHIRLLDWTFVKWLFTDIFYADYFRPVTWISYAVDYALWGLDPMGPHLTSVLLHAVNTFVVVCLISLIMEVRNMSKDSAGMSQRTDKRTILMTSGTTGMLFGLHPLHVESVAWISARVDPLYSLFFLLSILVYTKYVIAAQSNKLQGVSEPFWLNGKYLAALALFALSLLSKPMAVTLPVFLLMLDWYPFQRMSASRDLASVFVEKIPFVGLSIVVSVLAYSAEKVHGTLKSLAVVPEEARVMLAVKALVIYLWKTVMPVDLIILLRPYPDNISLFSFEQCLEIALVGGITILCILMLKRQRAILVAWGYFVITLLPVIDIITIREVYVADRYTYLPGLGPLFLMGLAASSIWTRPDPSKQRGFALKCVAGAIIASLLFFLTYKTSAQIAVWKNSITLWSNAIDKEPYSASFYYYDRGRAFEEEGRFDLAIEDFTAAIAIAPGYHLFYYDRGKAFHASGRIDRAIEDYNTAIGLNPGDSHAHTARGLAFEEVRQFDRAIEDFTAAIALDPYQYTAYTDRGIAFKEEGQFKRAIEDYSKAITLNPSNVEAYNDRGVAFKHLHRLDQAINDFNTAVKLNPSFYLAYCNRGIAYNMMGRFDKAIEDYTRALSLKPDLTKAYLDRGDIYERTGSAESAVRDYQKACDLGDKSACDRLHRNARRSHHKTRS